MHRVLALGFILAAGVVLAQDQSIKRTMLDRMDVPGRAADERLCGRAEARLPLGHLEDLRKLVDVDD